MRVRLKQLQTKNNLTAEEMAAIGGVSYINYWRILNNKIQGSFIFWMNIKIHFKLSDNIILEIANEDLKRRT